MRLFCISTERSEEKLYYQLATLLKDVTVHKVLRTKKKKSIKLNTRNTGLYASLQPTAASRWRLQAARFLIEKQRRCMRAKKYFAYCSLSTEATANYSPKKDGWTKHENEVKQREKERYPSGNIFKSVMGLQHSEFYEAIIGS